MKKCVKKVKSRRKESRNKDRTPQKISVRVERKIRKKSAEEKVKIFQAAEKCSNLKLISIHEQFNLCSDLLNELL